MKFVGDRYRRKEDPRLLTGRGRYVGDVALPGMLHAVLVRSPHAHARILRVDAARAREHPTVVDVVTHRDLGPAARELPIVPPHPQLRGHNFQPLAGDRARFAGEPVAAVVAASRYAAEDARDLVEVEYDPLPSAQGLGAAEPPVHDDAPDNVAGRVTLTRGDVETALRASPRVVQATLRIGRGGGQPMETRGLVADWNPALEQLTIWASSQVPHQIRQFAGDLLGLPPHQIRVVAPDVGGGFGAKLIVYPEDVLIPFLAHRLGRPVRWIEDRLEHMLSATQEREQEHDITAGFDGDGRLLAIRDRFLHDTGAYTPRGLVVPLLTASMLTGPYRVPAVEVTFESRYTHRVPVTPYRGAGQPQAVFAIERMLDRIARETGRDPAAVRLANLVRPEEMPWDVGLPNYRGGGNVIFDSGDFPAVLGRALDASRYEALRAGAAAARADGRLEGVGVACYVELTGVGPFEGARVRVDTAGRIAVFTGVTSQGQGLATTLAQVAADELGLTPDDVTVIAGDTAGIEQGIGSFASRAAVVGGSAVVLAARAVHARARELAARLLDVPGGEIEQDGASFAARGRRLTFADLARAASMATAALGVEPGLESTRFFQPADIAYSSGAHVARVEVDPASAAVRILGYWITHDSGRLINPMVVDGQIQGGVALGIGGALLEEVVYDAQGQPRAGSYLDYLLPTALDVPHMAIDHLETLSPLNPLGIKGVGESGTLPVAAALASAIEDAIGRPVQRVPVTPARLHALLASPAAPSAPAARGSAPHDPAPPSSAPPSVVPAASAPPGPGPHEPGATRTKGEPMTTFTERLDVLTAESARLDRYFRSLPPEALTAPSACGEWQVQDVVAHLVGVAEFYAGTVERGLRGETSALAGRAPAGTGTGATAAEGIAQRSIAARKTLGDRLLDTFAATGDHLNRTLARLTTAERQIPCYHPGGMVAAENFIELRLKELGVHEWDIRSALEPGAHLSPAFFAGILATISESIASGSLRWAFWSGPAPAAPVRYRFAIAGPGPARPDLVIDGQGMRMEDAGTARPDVTFGCDTESYILLVYGRLDLGAAMASGRVRVEGDRALAIAFGERFRGI